MDPNYPRWLHFLPILFGLIGGAVAIWLMDARDWAILPSIGLGVVLAFIQILALEGVYQLTKRR